jgi:hypothetical protein
MKNNTQYQLNLIISRQNTQFQENSQFTTLSLAKAYFSRKLPFYELNHAEPYLTKAEFA